VQARDAIYRFWALKVPPDHGIVTKTQRGVMRVLSQLPSSRTLSLTSAMGGGGHLLTIRLNDPGAK
jgi:hypothetical protein